MLKCTHTMVFSTFPKQSSKDVCHGWMRKRNLLLIICKAATSEIRAQTASSSHHVRKPHESSIIYLPVPVNLSAPSHSLEWLSYSPRIKFLFTISTSSPYLLPRS